MVGPKRQYNTPVGVVIIKELCNSAGKVTGYEGFMVGDDDQRLADTRRVVQVYDVDEAQLRKIRHLLTEAVVQVFKDMHSKMAMDRWNTYVAAGTAKIVHKHLCIAAREKNLIPSANC